MPERPPYEDGERLRRCTRGNHMRPTREFEWQVSRATYRTWCNDCLRAYYREYRRARRQQSRNQPVAAAAPRARRMDMSSRAFGVEFEFVGSTAEQVVTAMRAMGLPCVREAYGHATPGGWKIVPDGSVRDQYGYGGELVSPLLYGEDGFAQIRKATEALRDAGASVNTSCGLHVHHDARDLSVEEMARIVALYDERGDDIGWFLAPSRRDGYYCRRLESGYVAAVRACRTRTQLHSRFPGNSGMRFRAVNVCAHARHGSLEFRQHQGTLNGHKAEMWVRFTAALMEAGVDGRTVRSGDAFLEDLNVPENVRDYFTGRSAVFRRRAARRSTSAVA
jgi:hypothetical protein